MAKQQKQIKAHQTPQDARLEHTEIVDDSLLPDAQEIRALSEIDPSILEWLKKRAEDEQKHRHGYNDKKFQLLDDNNKREHTTTRIALVIYLILVAGCLGMAFYLLLLGKNIQGTIFGSVSVILALAVLVTRSNAKDYSEKKVKN